MLNVMPQVCERYQRSFKQGPDCAAWGWQFKISYALDATLMTEASSASRPAMAE